MAAKPQRTLFEAMRTAKGRDGRPVERPVEGPEKPVAKPVAPREPIVPTGQGRNLWRRIHAVPPRVILMVVGTVLLMLVVWLLLAQVKKQKGSPSIDEARNGGLNKKALDNTGPGQIRTGDRETYGQNNRTTGSGNGAVEQPPKPPESVSTGDFRVRICRSPVSFKKDFDLAVKYLKDNGVETYQEFRSGFYYLYSRQGFANQTEEGAQRLLARIKELGEAFPDVSRTNTDFKGAYILKKPVN